jgi:hypothetical protein
VQTDEIYAAPQVQEEETQPQPTLSAFGSVFSGNPFVTGAQEETCSQFTERVEEESAAATEEIPEIGEEPAGADIPPVFMATTEIEEPAVIDTPEVEEELSAGISDPPMPDTEVSFAGEMEQITPGHLRLPITIRCGQEVRTVSIDLRLSIDESRA